MNNTDKILVLGFVALIGYVGITKGFSGNQTVMQDHTMTAGVVPEYTTYNVPITLWPGQQPVQMPAIPDQSSNFMDTPTNGGCAICSMFDGAIL